MYSVPLSIRDAAKDPSSWRVSREVVLTRVKGDLADHNPARGEAKLQLDELSDAMVQLNRDISRGLEDPILNCLIYDGITIVVFTAHAEQYAYF